MTAWQYFAGAGLVAALCPLHGHVAVAGDGHGHGARVDLCVPGGRPGRPAAPPSGRPSVRIVVPGIELPTVRHTGPGPRAATGDPSARPSTPPSAAGAVAPAGPAGSVRADPAPAPESPAPAREEPDAAPAPARAAPAAPARAFAVRPYRAVALERRSPGGMSTVTLMVVVTTPAVLAAAALRPRSKSRG
ncbi:hypothetical protein AB0O18_01180 [Streptomyces sp. NPDC093224]|uniref:hypothetical protein n=1 Tax=Streptomyces sp. NPDC093224 TaxID=3155198 RepID=UPI00341ACDAF